MILMIHILMALSSILYSAITALSPSGNRIKASYVMLGATLATGVLLVLVHPQVLAHACITGLAYFAVIGFILNQTKKKLARENISTK